MGIRNLGLFIGILHIGKEEIYKFVFLQVEYLFILNETFFCSSPLTVNIRSLRLENFS